MNVRQLILWKPNAVMRGVIFAADAGLILLLGFVHYLTGLAYDFHVFFSLPVLLADWFLGLRPALAGALLSTAAWFLLDKFKQVNDEFALLFPGMDATASKTYVEELRQRLLGAMRVHGWPVTFSIGVASYLQAPDNLDRLLAEADKLMYEVKESVRDRILQKELREERN